MALDSVRLKMRWSDYSECLSRDRRAKRGPGVGGAPPMSWRQAVFERLRGLLEWFSAQGAFLSEAGVMRGRLLAVLCGGDALSSGQFMLLFPGDE